ncbi:hypothetical protein CBM2637_B90052 [Cupriavidus taiwanensis]|nr:hypothetical protein CBM2637_B90052 [Cupriavidus taiwanensis]
MFQVCIHLPSFANVCSGLHYRRRRNPVKAISLRSAGRMARQRRLAQ